MRCHDAAAVAAMAHHRSRHAFWRQGEQTEEVESAGKPGSVVDNHSSGICVTAYLKQPTRTRCEQHLMGSYLALLRVGFAMPWSDATHAVRSYRTISPLPPTCTASGTYAPQRYGKRRYLSVALSVGSRPPGVTWHPALWSPDFPPWSATSAPATAIVWPTQRSC